MIAKGNLTSYKADPNGANPTTFVWDFDNRLASADTDGDGTADVTFRYDALGRRVRKTTSASDTVFALAGQQVIAEYTSGAAPNAPNERYVYASYVDEPILKDGTLANTAITDRIGLACGPSTTFHPRSSKSSNKALYFRRIPSTIRTSGMP